MFIKEGMSFNKLSGSSVSTSDIYSVIHGKAQNNIWCAHSLENIYVIRKTKQTGLHKLLRPNN
jgi:hypothetical protein